MNSFVFPTMLTDKFIQPLRRGKKNGEHFKIESIKKLHTSRTNIVYQSKLVNFTTWCYSTTITQKYPFSEALKNNMKQGISVS